MRKFIPVIPPLTSFADVRLVLQNALSDISDRWMQWVNAPSFRGNRVTGVGDPIDSTDVATKGYVDRVAGAQSADAIGLLPASTIPPPTAGGRGGIKTQAAVASQWVTAINGNGTVSTAQPAFTDVSGVATLGQLPTNAQPLSTQTLPVRTVGTIYQNTGVIPMYVSILVLHNGGGASANSLVRCDSSATPTTIVTGGFWDGTTNTIGLCLAFVVLPGYYYQLVQNTGSITLNKWTEWT